MGEAFIAEVRERVNQIHDPCSLAQAIPVGLDDMGLVTDVRIDPVGDGRYDVTVVLRVTAPGCMYVPFMDRAVHAALEPMDDVRTVETDWERTTHWTPLDIAAPVRERLAEHRAQVAARAGLPA